MSGLKVFRFAVWAAVAVLGGFLIGFGGLLPGTGLPEPVETGTARVGGPFELISHKGETVDNAKLAGKPYLVFFGFTHCPTSAPQRCTSSRTSWRTSV